MKYKVGATVQWKEKLPTTGLPYMFQGVVTKAQPGACEVRMRSGVKRIVRNEVIRYADE